MQLQRNHDTRQKMTLESITISVGFLTHITGKRAKVRANLWKCLRKRGVVFGISGFGVGLWASKIIERTRKPGITRKLIPERLKSVSVSVVFWNRVVVDVW